MWSNYQPDRYRANPKTRDEWPYLPNASYPSFGYYPDMRNPAQVASYEDSMGCRPQDKYCFRCGQEENQEHRDNWLKCEERCWQCRLLPQKHVVQIPGLGYGHWEEPCTMFHNRHPQSFWQQRDGRISTLIRVQHLFQHPSWIRSKLNVKLRLGALLTLSSPDEETSEWLNDEEQRNRAMIQELEEQTPSTPPPRVLSPRPASEPGYTPNRPRANAVSDGTGNRGVDGLSWAEVAARRGEDWRDVWRHAVVESNDRLFGRDRR